MKAASDDSQAANAAHSRRSVALHSEWADMYADLYAHAGVDHYRDYFAYGRHLLDLSLDRYLPANGEGRRLLDVGCGTGHQLAALRARGYEVAGVDASEAMLRHARENNPQAEIVRAEVDRLPFDDVTFDYVISIEVLRHLRDPVPAIREFARVLKPGGTALATAAPILNLNLYWLVNLLSARVRIGNLRRLRQFFTTSGRLRRQFGDAGFGTVDVHGLTFGPMTWVERLAGRRTPAILRRWEPIDRAVADRMLLRELANMYLVRAVRK